jgi:hypothetical protein
MAESSLEWLKRGKKRTTVTAEVTAWDSRCGRYRVEVHKSFYERVGKRKRRRESWYALVKIDNTCEIVGLVSRKPANRKAAEARCQDHADVTDGGGKGTRKHVKQS